MSNGSTPSSSGHPMMGLSGSFLADSPGSTNSQSIFPPLASGSTVADTQFLTDLFWPGWPNDLPDPQLLRHLCVLDYLSPLEDLSNPSQCRRIFHISSSFDPALPRADVSGVTFTLATASQVSVRCRSPRYLRSGKFIHNIH